MKNKNISLDPIKLNEYIEQVGYGKDTILSELRSKTELLGDVAVMQIGQTQGSLIEILCQLGQFNKFLICMITKEMIILQFTKPH